MALSKKHAIKKTNNMKKVIYIIAALALIAFISLIPFDIKDIRENEIIDLPNTPSEDGYIHWHAKLDIVIDGRTLVIPANIGIKENEHAVIHTHEPDNILHIEQFPNETTMKVGYFFDIWSYHINKTVIFNETCILDKCNDAEHEVVMTVNGQRNDQYNDYVMKDNDKIKIEYKLRSEILEAN